MTLPQVGDQSFPDEVCSRCGKPISLEEDPVLLIPTFSLDGAVSDHFRYHPFCVRMDLLEELRQ